MRSRVGVDIVEVKRVARMVKNPRFLDRVYTREEVAYCRKKRFSAQHFAVRFANLSSGTNTVRYARRWKRIPTSFPTRFQIWRQPASSHPTSSFQTMSGFRSAPTSCECQVRLRANSSSVACGHSSALTASCSIKMTSLTLSATIMPTCHAMDTGSGLPTLMSIKLRVHR